MVLRIFTLSIVAVIGLANASTPMSGHVCMTIENFKTADNSSQFYECSALGKEEMDGYHLKEKYLGVWHLRDCPKGSEFDEPKQRCVDRKTFRRQQVTCGKNPTANGCFQPCNAQSSLPVVGAPCNWMNTPLQKDPASNAYFLQCAPQANVGCGEWLRVPCASQTVFDSSASVCVPMQNNNACGSQQVPVCACASAAVPNNCPGVTSCNKNVCCQPTDVMTGNFIQNQAPMCPGSGVAPLASCNSPCPQYSSCAQGIGCCPLPVGNVNQPQQGIQINLCPGSYSPPLGPCGSCPSGTQCNSQINMCCPSTRQPSTDLVYNVVLLCPNGSPAKTPCSAGCGSGMSCFQGACCPMSCPPGQSALGFCSAASSCSSGSCMQGCCCQEAVKLPVCSNGQISNKRCSVDPECGPNMECSNGGCCPMPFCPTGVQSGSRCQGGFSCPPGNACMEGLCCPLPRCPNGIISLGVCTRTLDCGRMGVECANGACCPLPMCPNNVVSTQRCSSGCNNCCPGGQTCMNGGCCALPQCPSGIVAVSLCSSRCSTGTECVNGGCCPLPRCPSGLQATQRCQMGMGCSPGHQCENGVCCAMPMCNTGSIAASVCGTGNACPIGFICEGRGCCQEPMPLCPNGGRAAQRCNRGAECPPGYGCTPLGVCCPNSKCLGGCCLLSMEPVCPARSNAICQCSASNGCPQGTRCTMGTCCSTGAVAAFNQVPGSNCQASTQCNGYNNQCAQCVQGVCACTNGAASNGASCLQMPPTVLTMARNGCDQYGSPCKFALSTARRRPIFAPIGNITEEPLFFNVASVRCCILNATEQGVEADNSCLPNEKCINGECRMKLWPGEYGCSTDLECSSRCPNTYCEKRKSDKNVAQCQCRDGMLLYGRCFSQCPRGFHESGAYCMHDDEETFWTDAEAQDNLKALLNGGQFGRLPREKEVPWCLAPQGLPKGSEFDEPKQRCVDRKTFRRQQVTCGKNPTANGCFQPCNAQSSLPVVGVPCNWMNTPLQRDPASDAYFLQCAPQANVGCGEWLRVPCDSQTVFDSTASVCVPMQNNNACGSQQVPVCACASAAVPNNCPGVTSCNKNVCCQPTDVMTGNFIQNQAPMCPGSGVAPLSSCNSPCPQYSSCAQGIGCCPLPVGNVNQPQQGIQINLCPGSYSPPLGPCGSCPSGTQCNSQINMCCPSTKQPSTDLVYNVVLLCPNGSPAKTPCSAGCGSGMSCFQGACCPMSCPPGQECGPNMECSNGGCCPMPFCPTGVQSGSRCQGGFSCPPGNACMEGLCCPLPRCPNGIISLGVCTRTLDCGRMGVECANGACCPLPMCPNNVVSTQRCSSGCNNCCPGGQTCMNGGCCQLPQCPSGIVAVSLCSSRCSTGTECVNGGCCPLPRCPSGLQATQRCQMEMSCSPGHQWENGVCCAMPMCSTGSIAASVCGTGNACPIGFICEGRGCCQEPMPLCPNGGRAAQRCNRGAECPPGYGCTPLGGCCLLSMEPVCPARSNAICQCSASNGCPQGTRCTMGTCCSTGAVAAFNQVPGSNCQASTQCNGYNNQCAQCVQGVCACTNGAASNGASCLQMPPTVLTMARNGCDQYGSPCKFALSTARRRPIFAPIGNITEEPLFFNVASVRRCILNATEQGVEADNSCLPNEKCINGECRMKLWPGEYGCSTDLECSSRCPNTYCEKRKSDKNVAQCQCRDGMLLYGRCFSQCPRGFDESGAYCMHDDEETFWSDAEAQDNLKALLNGGQC